MKNLFEKERADEVKERLSRLRSDSQRQWGKMSPAQAVAHCSAGLEWALGDRIPPRMFVGRVIGHGGDDSRLTDDGDTGVEQALVGGLNVRDREIKDGARVVEFLIFGPVEHDADAAAIEQRELARAEEIAEA